jgi:hypothetical protein
MSPQNHSGEISLYQRPPYVIHLQTVWRLYGDGMETHRFSVPADGDQDDLITMAAWRLILHRDLSPTSGLTCENAASREGARSGPHVLACRFRGRPAQVPLQG